MREIKFRAWDSYRNKMYEWDEICQMDKEGSLTLSNLLNNLIDHIKPIQFTGLTDKNGKECFENDIINYAQLNCVIEFLQGSFILRSITTKQVYSLFTVSCGLIEKISNIFENPEFLK